MRAHVMYLFLLLLPVAILLAAVLGGMSDGGWILH